MRASLPQSEMRPSRSITRAPQIAASCWLAVGASAGMTTVACTPAAAAYAARAPPALPADGATRCVAPSSTARLTATAIPLALKDPVGFTLSALMNSPRSPSLEARRAGGSSGVAPSPSVVTNDRNRTGSSSSHRQTPPCLPAITSGVSRSRAAESSYRARRVRPSAGSVPCSLSASYRIPDREPSRNSSVEAVRWLEPAIPAARLLHQRPPPSNVDLDPEPSSGGPNTPPRGIALSVRNAMNLVESRHRVAHVARVGDRLLALLGESEALGRKSALLARGQCCPLLRCQFIPPALVTPTPEATTQGGSSSPLSPRSVAERPSIRASGSPPGPRRSALRAGTGCKPHLAG